MAAVDIGVSDNLFTDPGCTRKIVKTTSGKLVIFSDLGTTNGCNYKTSSDDGDTWDTSWTLVYNTTGIYYFDVLIDNSNNIFLALTVANGTFYDLKFIKLTYSSGTWSIGTPVTIVSGASDILQCSITLRSNGDIWIGYCTTTTVYGYYSTNGGNNWNSTSFSSNTLSLQLITKGSDIWAFVINGTTHELKVYEYISSWDSGTVISGVSDYIFNGLQLLAALSISDSNIWIAAFNLDLNDFSYGLSVFNYTGTWSISARLTNQTQDKNPSLQNRDGNPIFVYQKYVNANNSNIVYIIYNGSSWDSEVALTSSGANLAPTTIETDVNNFMVVYEKLNSYEIYFDKVFLGSPPVQKTITSDVHFKGTEQETILSDVKFVIEALYNTNNKISFVNQILSNINNRINTVLQIISNINNFINTCKLIILDIRNDFRTKKLNLNNVTNDVRFIYNWQKATDNTLQSLGKGYIKVYIDSIEQTDVDIDSINITKNLSIPHTATFDLGRAYDTTKPTMETSVLIKYHIWTLFSGYITNISPSEDPEKIRINCQDEYWKQNKINVYYHIGHKPQDDKELYYETLQEALYIEHGWNPEIGKFTPETMDNFSIGKSDAISNIIKEIGNYGWFYDVDGNKKLWTAGNGSIIELERQTLGKNINLYDIINHSFEESVEDIINKFRVQMGNKVIRKFSTTGGNRTYTGYNYSSYHQFVTPAWDRSLELLSKQTVSGYGFDHQNPTYSSEYSLVFKKYNMPYLNPELSSWSDRYPPYVEIYNVGGAFGFVGPLNLSLEKVLKEGFTIDYENKTITFNEAYFLYQTDANGEITSVRAPIIKVFLWKKDYYTYTVDPTDNPETDISNPLMFFTDKMGSYTDTIIKDLNLSNLSIQEGGNRILEDGTEEHIPSWDDTMFALDLANWELSKSCDKKIKGTITITLDTICYYNIDLTKRIYIDEITDESMNIIGITYNLSNFTVSLQLENSRYYNRTENYQSHGE